MEQQQFIIRTFGGMNANDQEDELVMRSHQAVQGGYAQYAPVESPYLLNIDFSKVGIIKRMGSTEDSDLSGVLLASDYLIDGCEFFDPNNGVRYELIVSNLTIYLRSAGGAWAQINDSSSAAYTHAGPVTKCGFAYTDGHLFIGLDGSNQIQVFKSSDDLDDEMLAGNTYEEAYSVTTHTIDGTWPDGCYLVGSIHERLVFSDGNTILYYTPMAYAALSGIWNLAGATYFLTQGRIRSLDSMSPLYTDSLQEILYIGTDRGFEVLTGFDTTSDIVNRIQGSKSPMNHRCTAVTKNWLIYMTDDKNIHAVNKTTVIDIGRRMRASTNDGPLDLMYLTDALTSAFGVYNQDREQIYFYFPTSSARYNDTCVVIDLKLGEPIPGEQQNSYEQRVRLLYWQIDDPDDNDWFCGAYNVRGDIFGITKAGKVWDKFEDDDDLDAYKVVGRWKSPVFLAGGEDFSKQFMHLAVRTLPKGTFDVTVYIYLNRESSSSGSFTITQYLVSQGVWGTAIWGVSKWASTQLIKAIEDVDLYADTLQWEVQNGNSSEPFEVANMSLAYLIGASER